jgi:hypothetical protein
MAEPKLDAVQRIDHADAFFAATGADIRHGGNQAYYALQPDHVQMPPFECFEDPEAYYAVYRRGKRTPCRGDRRRKGTPHSDGLGQAAWVQPSGQDRDVGGGDCGPDSP